MTSVKVRHECRICGGWGWIGGQDVNTRATCRRCDGSGVVESWITLSELRRRMEEERPDQEEA